MLFKLLKTSLASKGKSGLFSKKRNDITLTDIDFELELIHRDLINVAYIIKLLAKLKQAKASEAQQQKKAKIQDQLRWPINILKLYLLKQKKAQNDGKPKK
jgi:hypothetical protein